MPKIKNMLHGHGLLALRDLIFELNADIAQLAERLICNQRVVGSSPIIGSTEDK